MRFLKTQRLETRPLVYLVSNGSTRWCLMQGADSAPTIRYEISHTLASESVRMMQDYNEIEEMGRNGRRYSWEVQRGFLQTAAESTQ